MREISVPLFTGAQHASWEALIEVAEDLGDDWALVGGQMVMLHALDAPSVVPRVSRDVDVVMDLRASPKSLARAHTALTAHGFEQQLSIFNGIGASVQTRGRPIRCDGARRHGSSIHCVHRGRVDR